MAASDKYKDGNRRDYARHYSIVDGDLPVCRNKNYGYSSSNFEDVDCKKCCKIIDKETLNPNSKEESK